VIIDLIAAALLVIRPSATVGSYESRINIHKSTTNPQSKIAKSKMLC